ncbi:MAG TPA: sigma factor, partial [Pseudonocardiaceae bacterium]|nr:sigma factor [Pseudonocardiaceae bacterium]
MDDDFTPAHRVLVQRLVSKKVPADQVEDLVQDTLLRAVSGLREMPLPPANLAAWLTTVTRYQVADHLRAKARGFQETELDSCADRLPPDPDHADQVIPRVGVHQFLGEAAGLLASQDIEPLRPYLQVANGAMSRDAMAEELHVPRNFNQFLARWRSRFREALLVLAYLTEPGVDEHCDFLATARQQPRSSALRRDVAKHIERCPRCLEHRPELDKLVRTMASAVPVVLPASVGFRVKLPLIGAGIAATACLVIAGVFVGGGHQRDATARPAVGEQI